MQRVDPHHPVLTHRRNVRSEVERKLDVFHRSPPVRRSMRRACRHSLSGRPSRGGEDEVRFAWEGHGRPPDRCKVLRTCFRPGRSVVAADIVADQQRPIGTPHQHRGEVAYADVDRFAHAHVQPAFRSDLLAARAEHGNPGAVRLFQPGAEAMVTVMRGRQDRLGHHVIPAGLQAHRIGEQVPLAGPVRADEEKGTVEAGRIRAVDPDAAGRGGAPAQGIVSPFLRVHQGRQIGHRVVVRIRRPRPRPAGKPPGAVGGVGADALTARAAALRPLRYGCFTARAVRLPRPAFQFRCPARHQLVVDREPIDRHVHAAGRLQHRIAAAHPQPMMLLQQHSLRGQFPPLAHHRHRRVPPPGAPGHLLVLVRHQVRLVIQEGLIQRSGRLGLGILTIGERERPQHEPLTQEVAPVHVIAVRVRRGEEIGDDPFRDALFVHLIPP